MPGIAALVVRGHLGDDARRRKPLHEAGLEEIIALRQRPLITAPPCAALVIARKSSMFVGMNWRP